MSDSYSLYEAKARLSEILRRVREGRTVTISYRGEPVAEVRPVAKRPGGIKERLRALAERGQYLAAERPFPAIARVAKRPGALRRFLRDRSRD
jgi:prevent-host-death family protein